MHDTWDTILQTLWKRSRFTSYFFQSVQFVSEKSIPTLALTLLSSRFILFYNRDFIENIDPEELLGLLVHEMLHVIHGHDHRTFPDEDLNLQNLAQDMVINSYLLEHAGTFFSRKGQYYDDIPLLVLPRGLPVIPKNFIKHKKTRDVRWEELYRWLKENIPGHINIKNSMPLDDNEDSPEADALSQSCGFESSYFPGTSDPDNSTDGTSENLEGLTFTDEDGEVLPTGVHLFHQNTIKEQVDAAKKRIINFALRDTSCRDERIFQDLNSIITEIQEVDSSSWRNMVKSIVDFSSQSNEWTYTYSRFNRRYFSNGLYAPGRIFKERQALTVVVDVSASMVMQPGDIEAAFGVIEELLIKYRVNLLCIDEDLFVPEKAGNAFVPSTELGKPYPYKKGDWKYIRSGNSGTTFFAPLFNDFMTHHSEMLIVITDGFIFDLNALKKYSPTLWLISEHRREPFTPPFGKAVTIKTVKDRQRYG